MSRNLNSGDVYVTDDAKASFDAAREAEAAAALTAADVVTTAANVVLSDQAKIDIEANVLQTAADRVATGEDRVATGLARTDATASVVKAQQAVADATLQVTKAQGEVVKATAQVGLAADQVELAKQAAAAGRIRYNTLALLNAALNYPEGTVAEVTNDGANNGTYRKSGGPNAGSWVLVDQTSLSALLARIQTLEAGMAPVKTYPIDVTGLVLSSERTTAMLPEDPQRTGDLLIQVIDKADAAFNFSSNPAAFDTTGSWPQKNGQWVNHGYVGTKAVNGIVRRVAGDTNTGPLTAKVNVRVQRLVDAPMASVLADAIFTRWPDPADQRYKDVIRTEIDYLQGQGILSKLKVWFMPGASRGNNMVNLADPNGPLFVCRDGVTGSIETQPYKWMKGNGVDQYIDTQRLPADIGQTLDGGFLAAKIFPGGGVSSDGVPCGNSSNYYIQPNRTTTLYGYRSGSGLETNDPTAPVTQGQWAMMNRASDAANLTGYVDEARIFQRPRVQSSLPSRTLNIMAANAAGGYTACSALPIHGVIAGFGLQDDSIFKLIRSAKRIQAVMATIAGA